MNIELSALLQTFFAQGNLSVKADTNNPQHTFVTSGFSWGTNAAMDVAEKELQKIASWARVGLSPKGRPSTNMVLPYPVAEVREFCDRQALIFQKARELPVLAEDDLPALAFLQADGRIRIDIERAVAADKARFLLTSEYWTKDDDFVSVVLPKTPSSMGQRPVLVYVRLEGDRITGVYDRARDEVILYGLHPADLAA